MSKFQHFDRLPAARPVSQEPCCNSNSPCVRCSMLRLISYRFAMFSKKFGRLPEQDDELFFDETEQHPVRASQDEIRNQVFAASEAYGLNCFMLLSYLGLSTSAAYDQPVV